MAEAERAHCSKIYISDIPKLMTKDHLRNLLENTADCFVEIVKWSLEDHSAVVEFEKDVEFNKLQSRCKNERWNVKMHKYDDYASTEFLLLGQVEKLSDDFLTNFLEVEMHIDCDVKKIHRGSKKDVVMVEFNNLVSMETLAMACAQTAKDELGYKLDVKPVSLNSAILVHNPNPATLTESFRYYFQNTKRSGGSKDAEVSWNKKSLVVHFDSREVAKRVVARKHTLEGYELQLELINLDLNSLSTQGDEQASALGCLNSDDDKVPSGFESISQRGVSSPSNSVSGSKAESDDEFNKIEKKISVIRVTERQPELVKQEVKNLNAAYLFLLQAFRKLIKTQFYTKVSIEDEMVIIKGDEKNVLKMVELLKILQLKQEKSDYLNEVAAFFMGWEAVFENLENQIKRGQYYLTVREDGETMEELTIGLADADSCDVSSFMTFDMFLARHVDIKHVPVDFKAAKYLLETTTWEEFAESTEDAFGQRIRLTAKDNKIFVVGDKDSLQAAAQIVQDFFQNKHTETAIFVEHPKVKDFFTQFLMYNLMCGTGEESLDIKPEKDPCKIRLSGCKQGVVKAERVLKNVAAGFCSSRVFFYYPGLGHFIANEPEKWKQICSSAFLESRCLGSDIPEVLIKESPGQEISGWGDWRSTVVQSFISRDQQLICHVVEGVVQDMKVDVIVVCQDDAEARGNQFRQGGQETDARYNSSLSKAEKSTGSSQSTRENIRITQPGYYPCKAVIRVELSRYFSKSHHADNLMNGVDELLKDILTACSEHHFSSMALPVFGADVPVSGDKQTYTIEVASKALITCISQIIQHQYYNQGHDRSQNRKRMQIFLCSTKVTCLRGLGYFFETLLEDSVLLHAQPEQSREIYRYLSCQIPDGNPRKLLQQNAVTVISGDIANSKDPVIVVPLDLDTDLDLTKSKVTQSLLNRGGSVVQSSIFKSDWSYPSNEDFEKAYAELADRRLLVGKAGYLSCSEIYYVYLPPWGPGVKKIFCDCLYKCLWKASRSKRRSVAMTALGVGKPFNYPVEFVARTLIATVTDFMEHEETSVECVTFVVYSRDHDVFKVFNQELYNWRKYQNQHDPQNYRLQRQPTFPYTSSQQGGFVPLYATNAPGHYGTGSSDGAYGMGGSSSQQLKPLMYPHSTSTSSLQPVCIGVKKMMLTVKPGNLFYENCDIIVNITNKDFNFGGSIASELYKLTGGCIVQACKTEENMKLMKKKGITVTKAFNLQCKHIVHMDFMKFITNPKDILLKCLIQAAGQENCNVIGFPAIGTGRGENLRNSSKNLLDHMVQAIKELQKPKNLKEVQIIVREKVFPTMANELQNIKSTQKTKKSREAKAKPPTGRPSSAAAALDEDKKTTLTTTHVLPWQRMATTTIMHQPECLLKDDIISLYLFSDKAENQQKAKDLIQQKIENHLGYKAFGVCTCSDKLARKSRGGGNVDQDQSFGIIQRMKSFIYK